MEDSAAGHRKKGREALSPEVLENRVTKWPSGRTTVDALKGMLTDLGRHSD